MSTFDHLAMHTHDLVDSNDLMRERYARMGRKLDQKEAERQDDEECKGIAIGVVLIVAAAFYVLLEGGMDALYNMLDRAGVFASIFKFMGW